MGVALREDRDGLSALMSHFGWDYVVYHPLVEMYEGALLDHHHKMQEVVL